MKGDKFYIRKSHAEIKHAKQRSPAAGRRPIAKANHRGRLTAGGASPRRGTAAGS